MSCDDDKKFVKSLYFKSFYCVIFFFSISPLVWINLWNFQGWNAGASVFITLYWSYRTTCECLAVIRSEKRRAIHHFVHSNLILLVVWSKLMTNHMHVVDQPGIEIDCSSLLFLQRSNDQQGQPAEFTKRPELDQRIAEGSEECCATWVDFN